MQTVFVSAPKVCNELFIALVGVVEGGGGTSTHSILLMAMQA